ncbi:hypothetical protein J6590_101197, partial [Homalodisca vitripennis]
MSVLNDSTPCEAKSHFYSGKAEIDGVPHRQAHRARQRLTSTVGRLKLTAFHIDKHTVRGRLTFSAKTHFYSGKAKIDGVPHRQAHRARQTHFFSEKAEIDGAKTHFYSGKAKIDGVPHRQAHRARQTHFFSEKAEIDSVPHRQAHRARQRLTFSMRKLKLTAFHIDKHTVRGNDSLLQCKYDLQDVTLYSATTINVCITGRSEIDGAPHRQAHRAVQRLTPAVQVRSPRRDSVLCHYNKVCITGRSEIDGAPHRHAHRAGQRVTPAVQVRSLRQDSVLCHYNEWLKLTALHIDKHTVRGNDSLLQCKYDLQDETLYSVKWYKDGHEFYRFVPRDFPIVQVFPVPGVYVN